MKAVECAAIDLGATSGRIIVGSWSRSGLLTLTEVHRFPNSFTTLGAHDYWDIGGLWREILTGLTKAKQSFPRLASVGICTWGVDHALVTERGRLALPVHAYRDQRTCPGWDRLAGSVEKLRNIYSATGIPAHFYNTSLQLAETLAAFPGAAQSVDRCLFLPDYFNYLLCGRMENEISIASTSQLLSVRQADWSRATLVGLGIPARWFSKPIEAGTSLGTIKGIAPLAGLKVIAVPGHDTACAFDAMPTLRGNSDLYVNSGTWSLIGFETSAPILNREALLAGIRNERTGNGAFRPLKSVTGMWLLERVLRELGWRASGSREWAALIRESASLPRPDVLLDSDDFVFNNPRCMVQAVDRFLLRRRQCKPRKPAAYARLIIESLAAGHAKAHGTFRALAGQRFNQILLLGGGSRNRLLCQATADLSQVPVAAFSLEGSAVGNLGSQFVAMGAVSSRDAFREALSRQFKPSIHIPREI